MRFDLYHWLFDDAQTAGGAAGPEPFRFIWFWIIFGCLGLLIAFYYAVEGRKRFVKNKSLAKYMLDKYLGWLSVLCIVALILVFTRVQMLSTFFAWRFWRVLWGVGLLYWAGMWLRYMIWKYPAERANMIAWQKREQYIPKSNKRKARAGSR